MFKIKKTLTEPKIVKIKKKTTKVVKEKTLYVKDTNKEEISNQYKELLYKFMPNLHSDIKKIVNNTFILTASISYTRAKISLDDNYVLDITINSKTSYILTRNGNVVIKIEE